MDNTPQRQSRDVRQIRREETRAKTGLRHNDNVPTM